MNKLTKNKSDKVLFGVCGGLAKSFGIDSSILRLAFILGAIFTGSILFWIYLLLAIILPTQD